MWSRYLIALPQLRKINKILCIYLTRLPVEFKLKAESHWNFSRLHKKALLSRKPIFFALPLEKGFRPYAKYEQKINPLFGARSKAATAAGVFHPKRIWIPSILHPDDIFVHSIFCDAKLYVEELGELILGCIRKLPSALYVYLLKFVIWRLILIHGGNS